MCIRDRSRSVVPAKAGTPFRLENWVPAFAGTTVCDFSTHVLSRLQGNLPVMIPAVRAGVRHLDEELLHVPGAGGAALGAQAAVKAHVLVLHHDSFCFQWT